MFTVNRETIEQIARLLKMRFPNLNAFETIKLAHDIVEIVEVEKRKELGEIRV